MPITATEAARARIAHLDSVGRIFRALASGGSRTSAASILDYQRGWNSRWRQIQEATALQGQHALANTLRELVDDGRWGTNTAYTTAVWISATPPPSRTSDFAAWWRTNGETIRSRVDAIYRLDRAIIDSAERPQTPPAPPVMPPMAVDAPPVIQDPSSSIEERWERDAVATSTGTREGGRSGGGGGGGAALGLLAVVGIGYWAFKSGMFNGVESVDFMGADEEDCGCDG